MKKKTKNRLIIAGILVTLLLAGFWGVNALRDTSQKRLKEQSEIVEVKKGDLVLYSVAKGKITSALTTEIKYDGTLKNNYAKLGDAVAKDFLLGQYKNIQQLTYNLRAKSAGIVTAVANAASPMYVISDPNKLQMEVQISEKDIAKIAVGQPSKIFIDALNLTVDGKVSKISLVGNTTTDFTTYTVTVSFDKADHPIFLGMTGSAKIETLTKKDIYLVPVESLIEHDGTINLLNADWFDNMKAPQSDYYIEVVVGSADIDVAEVSGENLEGLSAVILPETSTFTGFGGLRNANAD